MSDQIIAGPHRLFWASPNNTSSSYYLGMTGPEGITQTKEITTQDITSDQLGPGTIVDSVYQGGNVTLSFVLQEVKRKAVRAFVSPWTEQADATAATGYPELVGTVGTLASINLGLLTLVPLSDTPANSAVDGSNQSRAYRGHIIGPVAEFLDARARFIPVTFRCYPQNTGTDLNPVWKWWSWTTIPGTVSFSATAAP